MPKYLVELDRNAVQDLARLAGVGFAFGPAHRITQNQNAATRLLSQDPEAKGWECSRRTSPPLRGISVAVGTHRPLWFLYQVSPSPDRVVVRRIFDDPPPRWMQPNSPRP